ncbi:hypothetical protein GCK32_018230 [Trichostrongylus colubriformis]|uniref:Uncharacterized protein n=1 Tax=Trichostrongylus colubriformis TaxID=6319 RepID=A0AAN8FMI8_TRICO
MSYFIPGRPEHLSIFEIIFIVTGVIMIGILLIWCVILLRLHFLQRDLPDGQVIALQPVYPTPTPHPIVYTTTPASSMPTVTQPGDDEDTERPSTAPTATSFSTQSQHTYPHGQGRPMYGYCPQPYPAGAYPSYPKYHVVPAPVNLTPGSGFFRGSRFI